MDLRSRHLDKTFDLLTIRIGKRVRVHSSAPSTLSKDRDPVRISTKVGNVCVDPVDSREDVKKGKVLSSTFREELRRGRVRENIHSVVNGDHGDIVVLLDQGGTVVRIDVALVQRFQQGM